jgi:hypothetical protein
MDSRHGEIVTVWHCVDGKLAVAAIVLKAVDLIPCFGPLEETVDHFMLADKIAATCYDEIF